MKFETITQIFNRKASFDAVMSMKQRLKSAGYGPNCDLEISDSLADSAGGVTVGELEALRSLLGKIECAESEASISGGGQEIEGMKERLKYRAAAFFKNWGFK